MTINRRTLFGAFALLAVTAVPAIAGATDPLFVNMTTDDPHRASMALTFALNQQRLGHPVTIFFNDKGVFVVSVKNAETFGGQQKIAADIKAAGGDILVCPMCMKHYGVAESDLIPGAEVGNPEKTGAALFRDNGKTLTW